MRPWFAWITWWKTGLTCWLHCCHWCCCQAFKPKLTATSPNNTGQVVNRKTITSEIGKIRIRQPLALLSIDFWFMAILAWLAGKQSYYLGKNHGKLFRMVKNCEHFLPYQRSPLPASHCSLITDLVKPIKVTSHTSRGWTKLSNWQRAVSSFSKGDWWISPSKNFCQ